MTEYAEIELANGMERVVAIRVYNPPLADAEIPKLDNGKALLRPIVLEAPTDTNPLVEKRSDPSYVVLDTVVIRHIVNVPLSDDEKAAAQLALDNETRRNALPPYENEIESAWRIIKVLYDRLKLLENPVDPATLVEVEPYDLALMEKVMQARAAVALPQWPVS